MNRNGFPIVAVVVALVLVLAAGSAGVLALRGSLANAPSVGGTQVAQPGPGAQPTQAPGKRAHELPPELQGLENLPPAERFAHFVGAQVNLKDRNNQPLTVDFTPGTITAVSLSNLTIAANDGTTKSYGLSDSTAIMGKPAQRGAQPALSDGDLVIVVTFNNERIPRAVIDGGADGSGFGHGGAGYHEGRGR